MKTVANKLAYLSIILGCLWVYLLLGVPVAQAATLSPSSYNWSSTQDFKQSKVLGVTTQDQEASPSASSASSPSQYLQFSRYLFGGGLTPSNPFYFIKPLQENVQLFLTFDQKAKDELRIQIAGERLDEMQKLATSNNIQAITQAANAYDQTMTALSDNIVSLKDKGGNVDELLGQMEEETAKHNVILEQVRIQVPDQSEKAIGSALEASWKGTDVVADLNNRPAVPSDLVSRLQSLKSQGLLTPEEVTKLVGAKTRVEARQEVGKFVNEGVVSESDFLRLNETAKSLYPEEFYKVHETLRFQEMQKLEDQKPDDATLNKIQSFAKTYKAGDQVPMELRVYWVPVVRLEEIQNTLRPDLIDASLFERNDKESKKFNEMVERFKPRPEDIAQVRNFIQKTNADVNNLPPEYQRMYNIGQRYGAQCGAGFNWVPESQSPAGGYCSPNGSDASNGPNYSDFSRGKTCTGTMVNAKSSNGACSSYPSDCMPPGWSRTETCVATPVTSTGANTNNRIECPSNAHFVSVSYDPNGGYCIPNYTQVGLDQSTGTSVTTCPASTHRSYAGGPCISDNNNSSYNNPFSLTPLTTTPGGPYYTNSGRCGPNAYWVPESINPQGGYCAQSSGTDSVQNFNPDSQKSGNTPSRESQEAACRSGGGVCVGWVNGACGCERSGSGGFSGSGGSGGANAGGQYGSPSRESQEAACRWGGGVCRSWVNGACGCERSGSGNTGGTSGTGNTSSTNTTPQYGSSSRESQEAACRSGGGTCVSWVNGACGCVRPQDSANNPPAGYGSCSSGQYWNGSSCQTPPVYTPPTQNPSTTSTPQPTSNPAPPSTPPPDSNPAPPPPQPSTSNPPSEPQQPPPP